jgi:hypothetical protein
VEDIPATEQQYEQSKKKAYFFSLFFSFFFTENLSSHSKQQHRKINEQQRKRGARKLKKDWETTLQNNALQLRFGSGTSQRKQKLFNSVISHQVCLFLSSPAVFF